MKIFKKQINFNWSNIKQFAIESVGVILVSQCLAFVFLICMSKTPLNQVGQVFFNF